jgi:hypothetical protein
MGNICFSLFLSFLFYEIRMSCDKVCNFIPRFVEIMGIIKEDSI